MTGFDKALVMLKSCENVKVARKGWNGKNMFIYFVKDSSFFVNKLPLLGIFEPGTKLTHHAHIVMKTADNQVVPWLASQTDLLAEDWVVVE